MRCKACDRNLSIFESTRKMDAEKGTGEYPDLCTKCLNTIREDIGPIDERPDLVDNLDLDIGVVDLDNDVSGERQSESEFKEENRPFLVEEID